ncbi:MAG: SPFH domain-containing protein, partial [Lentisphaeraceae bacterium]|nr:SPFH domain-containing protein [Lentisphaeraceae bacterium]
TSEDPKKISTRLVNRVKVFIKEELQKMKLTECLQAAERLSTSISAKLAQCSLIQNLGLEILDFNILALKPNPDTFRALEAKVREQFLKQADEARYDRRNASVEQERAIKENEFNTEIAIENKKKEVEETKLKARRELQEQDFMLRSAELASGIELEERNKDLVALETQNDNVKSDAKAYAVETLMKAYEKIDPKVIQALAVINMDSPQIIANAFNELASNAGKIGELNISPDLLNELMKKKSDA